MMNLTKIKKSYFCIRIVILLIYLNINYLRTDLSLLFLIISFLLSGIDIIIIRDNQEVSD